MKIISWNVNGLRAILAKNFEEDVRRLAPDILCLQEIKAQRSQLAEGKILPLMPQEYFHSAERLGYAGTAIFAKEPQRVLNREKSPDSLINPQEGRVQILDCNGPAGGFFLVNVYTPNAGAELVRLGFRHGIWDPNFCDFLKDLEREKPVIVCGDLNVAHREIDLTHPEQNHNSAGFTDGEREGFSRYLARGFVDVFRQFYPDKPNCYTWWSYRMAARRRNVGWRIDYFLASRAIVERIGSVEIYSDVLGSDHAPIGIELEA